MDKITVSTYLDLSLKKFPIKVTYHIKIPSLTNHIPSFFLDSQYSRKRHNLGVVFLC